MSKTFQQLLEEAQSGDTSAMMQLAAAYYNGDGIKEDKEKAFQWTLKAAEHENADAERSAGIYYYQGKDVKKDIDKSVYWLKRSAEHGCVEGMETLAYTYLVLNNITDGIYWLKKAAENGLASAACDLGKEYQEGIIVPKDYNEAFKWYEFAANMDDPHGIYLLSKAYKFGVGTGYNMKKSIELCHKAASMGDGDACYEVGKAIVNGDDLDKDDYKIAYDMFGKGASKGHLGCLTEFAELIYDGHGKPGDTEEFARECLEQAASRGYEPAMVSLGNYFYIDSNDKAERKKGYHLMERGALSDIPDAMIMMAKSYCLGSSGHDVFRRLSCLTGFVKKGNEKAIECLKYILVNATYDLSDVLEIIEEDAISLRNQGLCQALIEYYAAKNTIEELEKGKRFASVLDKNDLTSSALNNLRIIDNKLEKLAKKKKGFWRIFG